MKLLKTSIFVLFLLSLLSAGLTFYLSTIRENEKEKRVYLEGVKADLEKHVAGLETEKAQLEKKVTSLESENQEVTKKFEEEKEAHQKVLDQLHEKDQDLESLKGTADQAKKAFENAQKRNQELERILDELESRMRQVESQKNLTGPNAGYIDVSVVQAKPNTKNLTPGEIIQPTNSTVSQTPQLAVSSQEAATTPVTNLPTPPKRRKFFPFFHSSNQQSEMQTETSPTKSSLAKPVAATTTEEAVPQTPTEKIQKPVKQQAVPKTPSVAITTTAAPHKADQSIAAGNVLLVNRQYNFIVINLGSRQGLNLDNVLAVQHNGTEIAKVRVEKLYDDYSAAYIVEEQSEHPIAEGDSVTAV